MQDEDELECVPYTPVTITMRVTREEEGQIVLFLYLLRICTLLFWSTCIINAFIIILHKNFFLSKDVYATMTDILSNYTDNLSNLDTLS